MDLRRFFVGEKSDRLELRFRREGEQETARHGELRIVPDPRLAERNPGRVTRIPDPYGDWTPWGQYWPGREERKQIDDGRDFRR